MGYLEGAWDGLVLLVDTLSPKLARLLKGEFFTYPVRAETSLIIWRALMWRRAR